LAPCGACVEKRRRLFNFEYLELDEIKRKAEKFILFLAYKFCRVRARECLGSMAMAFA
jgi:hypothetical protein